MASFSIYSLPDGIDCVSEHVTRYYQEIPGYTPATFNDLPNDILLMILSHCKHIRSLHALSATCRRIRDFFLADRNQLVYQAMEESMPLFRQAQRLAIAQAENDTHIDETRLSNLSGELVDAIVSQMIKNATAGRALYKFQSKKLGSETKLSQLSLLDGFYQLCLAILEYHFYGQGETRHRAIHRWWLEWRNFQDVNKIGILLELLRVEDPVAFNHSGFEELPMYQCPQAKSGFPNDNGGKVDEYDDWRHELGPSKGTSNLLTCS